MKIKASLLLCFAAVLPSALLAQSATVQMQCRSLTSSNNYIAPDETYVNGMACKPALPASASAPAPLPATSAPSQTPSVQPAAYTPPAPAPAVSRSAEATPASIPTEAGMYVATTDGFTKILGQILDFQRSGSLLASKMTFGIKTAKNNVQLLGAHAQTVIQASSEFYFIPAKQEADAGVNAGDLILVRLEEKKDRRQIEVGAEGDWRASKGISLTHQIQLNRSEVQPGVYKIAPAVELGRGEYGLYLSRGEGMSAYIYDFSIQ
jgi:hypothetical protein